MGRAFRPFRGRKMREDAIMLIISVITIDILMVVQSKALQYTLDGIKTAQKLTERMDVVESYAEENTDALKLILERLRYLESELKYIQEQHSVDQELAQKQYVRGR